MNSYKQALTANPAYLQMFEWWEPLAGAPCSNGTLANYKAHGAGTSEVVHAPADSTEGHCVRPGRYAWEGGGRDFDVDYIQPSGNTALNSATGLYESIEVTTYNAALTGWLDLVINTDYTTTHPGDTPVLDIDNAGSNPYSSSFSNQASPSGTMTDWFRFSASRSTSGWNIAPRGAALARLYFDASDTTNSTAYYDFTADGGVIRLHKYPNPTTASKVYTVGLDLLRPDEQPGSSPSVTRTITINRIKPDLAPGTITMPSSAALGAQFTATIQEKNLLSNVDIEAPWIGRLYFSTDQTLNTATDSVASTFTETVVIGPGATRTVNRTVTVPTTLAPGNYYLLARLDTANAVLEANEANNTGASAATVTIHCEWTPSGSVGILVGSPQTFIPSGSCSNHQVTITPSNAPFGFLAGTGCTLKAVTPTSVFKIKSCGAGGATVTITLGGNVVQVINLTNPL